MRILQARFHFHADSQHAPIVVGHLVWESDEPAAAPVVRPAAAFLRANWPATTLAKLDYFIQITQPDSFSELRALGTRLWSFVEVTPREVELVPGGSRPDMTPAG